MSAPGRVTAGPRDGPPAVAPPSAAALAAVLEIAADAVITVDAEYRIVQYNRGARDIFGYEADEVVGGPLERLIPERFRAAHRGHVTTFAAAAHTARRMGERQEIWGLRRDGTEFPADASIARVDTPGGRLYTVVLRDVTARHRADEGERMLAAAGSALARSLDPADTARAAAAAGVPRLADAAVVGLWGGAAAGAESADRLTDERYDPGVAEPPAAAASRHPDADVASLLDALAAEGGVLWRDLPAGAGPVAVEGGAVAGWVARHAATPTVRALVRALRPRALLVAPLAPGAPPAGAPAAPPPGALTLFALHGGGAGAPAFDAADRALAAALAERVALAAVAARLYADARRAVRARDEVLAVVAHDLRTPLGAVATLARALHDGVRDATVSRAEQLDGLATIREAAGLGDRLIRDLLDAALIDAGRLRVDRRPVAPATVVAGALALFAGAVAARGITLVDAVAPGLPDVEADGARLVQAVANLVENAIRHTPAGGRVTVAARPASDGGAAAVAFVVADTGSGIAAEDLPHLFDARWHARRRARGTGSGLGLRIARGLARAHGGDLRAASAPGAGATFTLTVPAAAGAAAPDAPPAAPPAAVPNASPAAGPAA